jgi:cytochrome c peroxidase
MWQRIGASRAAPCGMLKLFGAVLPMAVVGCMVGDSMTFDDPGITVLARCASDSNSLPNNNPLPDGAGTFATVSTAGNKIDLGNEFFQDLGANGRRCVSCHVPAAAWSITPSQVRAVFDATNGGTRPDPLGLGAIFRSNDGSNAPNADVSTLDKRRTASSMLLSRGLIRVGLSIPANAEFELVAVDDPYHFASAAELSLFRRPLPSTNLKFLSTVMWDGRETQPGQSIHFDLSQQATDATQGHAQGDALTSAQRESIVALETALFTAQVRDNNAGELTAYGGNGGPDALTAETFYLGINDNFGDSQTHAPFTPVVFDIYDAWAGASGSGSVDQRRAIARGQALFNTRTINITGVSGINDEDAFGNPATVAGTCTTCHDTPNSGNHSVVAPLNIGLTDASRRTPDMPLYTLRNKTTGEIKQTTDPGRAMISGLWKHVGRFKGPILRALAARAPYFHNGLAADLDAVVDFYNQRFNMGLSRQEHSDLVAFLRAL